jgi:hypothetical protein
VRKGDKFLRQPKGNFLEKGEVVSLVLVCVSGGLGVFVGMGESESE